MPIALSAAAPARWSRQRRIAELLVVLWIIGLGDLWLTLWAHHNTAFLELNPLAGLMLARNATTSLVVFKIVCMAIATIALWQARRTKRCELATWAMTGIYFLLLLRWSEYTAGVLGR